MPRTHALAPASAPDFRVNVVPGTPLAARLEELQKQVEGQLEWEDDLTECTPEIYELLTIVLRIKQLKEDPFYKVMRVLGADGRNLFVSFLHGGTFFHTVVGRQVWLLGAIFSVDGPSSPEPSCLEEHSITTLATLMLRFQRDVDLDDGFLNFSVIDTFDASGQQIGIDIVDGSHRTLAIRSLVAFSNTKSANVHRRSPEFVELSSDIMDSNTEDFSLEIMFANVSIAILSKMNKHDGLTSGRHNGLGRNDSSALYCSEEGYARSVVASLSSKLPIITWSINVVADHSRVCTATSSFKTVQQGMRLLPARYPEATPGDRAMRENNPERAQCMLKNTQSLRSPNHIHMEPILL